MSSFWERKTFCLIAGASKGLGEGIACTFASRLVSGSVLVLLSRNEEKLQSVKSKINEMRPDLKVVVWVIDLCVVDGQLLKQHFEDLFEKEKVKPSDFTQCLLVCNSGISGNSKLKIVEQRDKKYLDDFWSLNLTSTILMCSVFFDIFSKDITPHRYAVQITSKLALKLFRIVGIYCAATIARNVLFAIMASENPDIKYLSYAPGALRTGMFDEGLKEIADEETMHFFREGEKIIVTPEESSCKLAIVLQKNGYKSGSHVDFYEVDNEGSPKDPESLQEFHATFKNLGVCDVTMVLKQ